MKLVEDREWKMEDGDSRSSILDLLSSILNPPSSTLSLMMRLMLMPAAMFGVAKD
ncbi:MAG: hypothetical protein HYW03_13250 [Deltaproteobacteria bacterium]|nr:hypothetical protein [Deltaproteobacteria bacterium]